LIEEAALNSSSMQKIHTFLSHLLSQTKKTEIVDVVIVRNVMWAEGWGKG
jgi:hypothetical protein